MDLKEFYEKWSKTEEGDQNKWLEKDSFHYERFMSYLKLSKPYIKENSKILDIGCGEGNLLSILPKCKKYGIDIASRYVKIAKKKNPKAVIKIGDVEKLPFKDGFFDFVFCTEVIEHVSNPKQLLKEIKRVLKPKAKALISTYNHWNLRNILILTVFTKKFVSKDHLREYNYWSLKRELEKEGFKIKKTSTTYSGKLIGRIFSESLLNKLKLNKFLNFLIEKT